MVSLYQTDDILTKSTSGKGQPCLLKKKKQLSVVVNEINLTMIDVLWLENNSRRVN